MDFTSLVEVSFDDDFRIVTRCRRRVLQFIITGAPSSIVEAFWWEHFAIAVEVVVIDELHVWSGEAMG